MTAGVLLNIDLGELPDEPPALYAFADVASIACGGHAGDADSMRRAVERCRAAGTKVGAHPSYPDREGFGRRPMELGGAALREIVAEQCARLLAISRA
ncbi:MAG: LamB/YcsF family protein, partial [Myxococcota bacterium]|nr:LamB/YcsF family protein [Myxococcota bacterium]